MKKLLVWMVLASVAGCGSEAPPTRDVYEALTCVRDTQGSEPKPSKAEMRRIKHCKQSQSVQRTRMLMSQGTDIEEMKQKLLSAAEDGSVSKLKSLIESGANVNWVECRDKAGSALDIAAMEQHVEAVDYLLQQGAKGAAGTALLAQLAGTFGAPLNETQTEIQRLLRSSVSPPEPCETPPTSATVVAGDASISYEIQGVGSQPLVFLHDWSCDRNCLRELAEKLSGEYRLVLLDFGGYGESSGSAGSMDDLVSQTRAVIEDSKLAKPLLLGHGLGAAVALRYAVQYEEQVAGLVLLGLQRNAPPSFEPLRSALGASNPSQALLSYLRKRNGMTGGSYLTDLPLQTIMGLPAQQLDALIKTAEAYDAQTDLTALSVPVSCIDFDEGRDYGEERPKEAFMLHGCLTQPLQNAGFYMMLENPPAAQYYTHEALRLLGTR